MQREAELHATEDSQRREEVEVRNMADSLAYQAERTLTENADKISEELKDEVTGKIAAVRSALQSGSVESIQLATQELNESLQKVSAAVYQQQEGAGAAAGGAPSDDATPRRRHGRRRVPGGLSPTPAHGPALRPRSWCRRSAPLVVSLSNP